MPTATLAPPADRPTVSEPPAPDVCLNCGAERIGAYCQTCGQHHLDGRITFRLLWREFTERFLKLERGLFGTVRGMTTRPGGVARDYVEGQRRRYINPMSYLIIGSALSVLAMPLYSSPDDIVEEMNESGMMEWAAIWGSEMASGEAFEAMSPEKQEKIRVAAAKRAEEMPQELASIMALMAKLNAALSVVLALFVALTLKLFFRGRGQTYTLAETMAFTMYAAGHYLLLAPLLLIVVASSFGFMWTSVAGFAILAMIVVWGVTGFYERTWGAAALGLVTVLTAYTAYTLFTGVIGAVVGIASEVLA
jgi:hypothetical protein